MTQQDYTIEAAISQQIAVEQGLRSARMSWNLTFQGFMMAAFALVAAADMNPARYVLELAICLAGFAVGLGTYLGILAAQKQSDYLKVHWTLKVRADSPYPRPFSEGGKSKMGRAPTNIISWTAMAMWVVLMAILLAVPLDIAKCNSRFGILGPILCIESVKAKQT